eukprot:15096727-Alexandrium_andersonii.AAC.1
MEKDGGPRAARMRERANRAVAAYDTLRQAQATAADHCMAQAGAQAAPGGDAASPRDAQERREEAAPAG